jgi:type III pantothenate kinase
MNLLIDSGNTFIKAAFCNGSEIGDIEMFRTVEDLKNTIAKQAPENIIISSVNKSSFELASLFPKSNIIHLTSDTPIPISNKYLTPQTLGMDRLAAVIGANFLFPKHSCLCIDAGTCITYDIIDEKSQYWGGSISPGVEMRFKALNTFTAKLPLIVRTDNVELTGNNTENSILSGVQIGAVKEMEGIIVAYKANFNPLKVLLTGGDLGFFESRIKEPIFAEPKLLFFGLKRILEYNVQ